jgi:hypothetical protein
MDRYKKFEKTNPNATLGEGAYGMYICIYMCMYLYIHLCLYVCVYIHEYI